MYTSTNNALSVIRLILRNSTPLHHTATHNRRFTTVYPLQREIPPVRNFENNQYFSPSPTSTIEDEGFLEEPTAEYSAAVLKLPRQSRSRKPADLPWPTLFSPSEAKSRQAQNHACEPLHQLIVSKDYTAARSVLAELLDHGVTPRHHKIYLEPATACLFASPPDTKGFLQWLELYPNRPATRNHPGLRAIWDPILRHLLEHHTSDTNLLSSFLYWSARKGFHPTVLPNLLYILVHVLPPHQSLDVFKTAIKGYYESTTSSQSMTLRAAKHRAVVDEQVEGWWNRYLQYMILAGWHEEAMKLYVAFDESWKGRLWDEKTKDFVKGWILDKQVPEGSDDKMDVGEEGAVLPVGSETLAKRLLKARYTIPNPTDLAILFEDFDIVSKTHPKLQQRLRRLYLPAPDEGGSDLLIGRKRAIAWHHAEIIHLQDRERFTEAIAYFQRYFLWFGIPDHPLQGRIRQDENSPTLFLPNIFIITTLLRSLLVTLPEPLMENVVLFHQDYLQLVPSLAPSLQPNRITHNVLIREVVRYGGVDASLQALRDMDRAGIDPYEQPGAVLTVLKGLVRRGRYGDMWGVWNRLEEDAKEEIKWNLAEYLEKGNGRGFVKSVLGMDKEVTEIESLEEERIALRG